MRNDENAFSHAKPPPEDCPMFFIRDTGADREPAVTGIMCGCFTGVPRISQNCLRESQWDSVSLDRWVD
jgi:hypothetical protein